MKLVLMALSLLSFNAWSQQDCFKQNDPLDRKYCMDKYLQKVKKGHADEKAKWEKGIVKKDKDSRAQALTKDIQDRKDHIAILQSELALSEQHLTELNAAKTVAPAKPAEPEKKKKKKSGFRIKL